MDIWTSSSQTVNKKGFLTVSILKIKLSTERFEHTTSNETALLQTAVTLTTNFESGLSVGYHLTSHVY